MLEWLKSLYFKRKLKCIWLWTNYLNLRWNHFLHRLLTPCLSIFTKIPLDVEGTNSLIKSLHVSFIIIIIIIVVFIIILTIYFKLSRKKSISNENSVWLIEYFATFFWPRWLCHLGNKIHVLFQSIPDQHAQLWRVKHIYLFNVIKELRF